jgi:hypothetical protein
MTFTIIHVGTGVLERTFLRSNPEPSQTFFFVGVDHFTVFMETLIQPTTATLSIFGCPETKNHPLERGRTAKREALKFRRRIICGDQSYLVDCIVQ